MDELMSRAIVHPIREQGSIAGRRDEVADLVISALAQSEAELLERVHVISADRDLYREMAQQAIHALHDMTIDRDRLRTRYHTVLEERRASTSGRVEAA